MNNNCFSFFFADRPRVVGNLGRHAPEPLPDTPDLDMPDGLPFQAMGRMTEKALDAVLDNSDRREIGKGFIGNLFEREYRDERIDSEIKQQIDEMDDHRCVENKMYIFLSNMASSVAAK